MFVAVYGTLKQGYGNNRLLANSTFVGEGTVRGYKLYHAGFPVACPDENSTISVELWDIGDSKSTLQSLDWLEGYDANEKDPDHNNMYNRTPVKVFTDSGSVEANMYVGASGFWKDFVGMKECSIVHGSYKWSR
jgi:gamma-glutamylcyclotransferase (GGCT)/AIG2-like uncharacterized protein YtfP